jgi:enolase
MFRGERTAKHNRMMRIEQRLDNRAVFAGESMRNPYWLLQ